MVPATWHFYKSRHLNESKYTNVQTEQKLDRVRFFHQHWPILFAKLYLHSAGYGWISTMDHSLTIFPKSSQWAEPPITYYYYELIWKFIVGVVYILEWRLWTTCLRLWPIFIATICSSVHILGIENLNWCLPKQVGISNFVSAAKIGSCIIFFLN